MGQIDKIGTNKGTGESVRVPGVGTFVSGKDFFGRGVDKYFDQSGNRINFEEFSEKIKSKGAELKNVAPGPKLKPTLSPTPPKPLENLQSSASYEDSANDVTIAIQPIIITRPAQTDALFG